MDDKRVYWAGLCVYILWFGIVVYNSVGPQPEKQRGAAR